MIKQISSKELHSLIQQNSVVIIDFYASWCFPCKMMSEVLENIASQYTNIIFAKINIDDETQLAIKQRIEAVPTIVAYKNGQEINRMLGYHSQEEFMEFLNNLHFYD